MSTHSTVIPAPDIIVSHSTDAISYRGVVSESIAAEFDVSSFGGSKAIVLSTMSYIGGKHNFMAISYLVVGIVCLLEGIVFGVLHMTRSRKLGDLSLLNDLN